MDMLDKMIIARLMCNCRESYRSIARRLQVTCPTVAYRVQRLRQLGVIQRFVAEISHMSLGVDWVFAELQAAKNTGRLDVLKAFESNPCIGDVFVMGKGRYIVLAEVYPEERNRYVSCLKEIEGIDYIELSDMHQLYTRNQTGRCKYTTEGARVMFGPIQVDLLRLLVKNARVSMKELVERTGYGPKLIRRHLKEFCRSDGVHMTLKLNLTQCGHINFVLKTWLADAGTDPKQSAEWVAARYPEEHWFSFFTPRSDCVIHYMTVKYPNDIEAILNEVIKHPDVDDVEGGIVYSMYKSNGRAEQFIQRCAEGTLGVGLESTPRLFEEEPSDEKFDRELLELQADHR
jgi:DNA-binding Lrp family transcriptional regulator